VWSPGDSDRTGQKDHQSAEVSIPWLRAGIWSVVPVEIWIWREHLLYKAKIGILEKALKQGQPEVVPKEPSSICCSRRTTNWLASCCEGLVGSLKANRDCQDVEKCRRKCPLSLVQSNIGLLRVFEPI
jgi:hypothetical protein